MYKFLRSQFSPQGSGPDQLYKLILLFQQLTTTFQTFHPLLLYMFFANFFYLPIFFSTSLCENPHIPLKSNLNAMSYMD